MNPRDQAILQTLLAGTRREETTRMKERTYAGKIRKAVEKFDDPFEHEVAAFLTSSCAIGVLRGLEHTVHDFSREFTTSDERSVVLHVLAGVASSNLDDLTTAVRGILQEPGAV